MMDSFIRTSTGQPFEFPYGKDFDFAIEGIAHALGHICRFGGHCHRFYSVAQHSVLVASLVPPEHRMAALLHDAHEAFIGDMVAPLKQFVPEFRRIEEIVEANLRRHFGVPEQLDPVIRHADLVALATEARDLTGNTIENMECLQGISPNETRVTPMRPWIAKKAFLEEFEVCRQRQAATVLSAGSGLSHTNFHDENDTPPANSVFVFGSNLAGKHGAGAAKFAMRERGAIYGRAHGAYGNSYAIPTRDRNIQTIDLATIKEYINAFLEYASSHPEQKFHVTRIGCGLAGYRDHEVAPLFAGAPGNCSFAEQWREWLVHRANKAV